MHRTGLGRLVVAVVLLSPSLAPGDISVLGETALGAWKQDVIDFGIGIGITFH
jgi:hypothetical protein